MLRRGSKTEPVPPEDGLDVVGTGLAWGEEGVAWDRGLDCPVEAGCEAMFSNSEGMPSGKLGFSETKAAAALISLWVTFKASSAISFGNPISIKDWTSVGSAVTPPVGAAVGAGVGVVGAGVVEVVGVVVEVEVEVDGVLVVGAGVVEVVGVVVVVVEVEADGVLGFRIMITKKSVSLMFREPMVSSLPFTFPEKIIVC